MIADWIDEENFGAFLEIVGVIVGYQFDPAEVVLIEAGVRETDGDADRWFEYQVPASRYSCGLRLAHDPGTCVIQVQLDTPALAADQFAVAFHILQTYYLRATK